LKNTIRPNDSPRAQRKNLPLEAENNPIKQFEFSKSIALMAENHE
jgi:hypothetical protein